MFKGGSYWKPPPMNPYTQGMPEELVEPGDLDIIPEVKEKEDTEQSKKGKLTDRYDYMYTLPFSYSYCV